MEFFNKPREFFWCVAKFRGTSHAPLCVYELMMGNSSFVRFVDTAKMLTLLLLEEIPLGLDSDQGVLQWPKMLPLIALLLTVAVRIT